MATMRQKKAIQLVVENHGNISKSMREAGYPFITAKNPKNLTESKAWLELVDQGLPDDLLLQVHREGLQATKRSGTGGMKIGIGAEGDVTDFGHTEIDEPDYQTRHKYLDTAYKLKGLYAPEKSQSLNVNVDIKASAEDEALAREYENKLKERYEPPR